MVSVSDVLSQVRGRRGLGADEVEGTREGTGTVDEGGSKEGRWMKTR